jgi:uncharacterized protein YfaS (alpha-2-macroglobulin family)
MTNLYKKGQKVRCAAMFRVNGVLTDPTSVTFKSKDPSGNVSTETPVRDSTGNYHVDVTTDENGEWPYRFEGTGLCTAVEEDVFVVTSAF